MPKYIVTLEEVASYEVTVEAENEDAAAEAAEEKFVNAPSLGEFPCEVHEREVGDIKLVE